MNIGRKIVSLGVVTVAGLLSDSIVKLGWKIATGRNPSGSDDLETDLVGIATSAVLSGVLLTIARHFTV